MIHKDSVFLRRTTRRRVYRDCLSREQYTIVCIFIHARLCFILFSPFHYLYYTTRTHDTSNRTSSFEYYIFKYSLYFSKYLKRD